MAPKLQYLIAGGERGSCGSLSCIPVDSGSMLSVTLRNPRKCLFLLHSASRLPGLSLFRNSRRPGTMAVSTLNRGLPLVAVCQVTSTPDKEQTFAACSGLVREAAKLGACLAFLPEAFDFIARDPAETLQLSEPLGGDLVSRYAQLARECGLWISLGGFHERGQDWEQTQRIYNCHVLLDNKGSIVATYRKTHLCDVELPGQGSMCESNSTAPGPTLGSPISTPAGKVGLAICYDLRFPELSLALAQNGAEILTYPSAFGSVTGPAHWEVLLRARAIETQCYVVAAAQWGQHHEKRGSYGHSMVVDPWGVVVARCSEGPGLCLAHIDLAYLRQVRQHMPVAQHRRPDLYGNLGRPDL
ncbi:deaminated glutathione amidase isoform X3 [Monodelphis domestica]|uniref:Deaminated glutathione amidase n=2 Tax=Monodelphis domestica TaxID=13616 RepID=F7CHA1_MONDO|nr:deaminated glutathione amidase isoform X3 [Monodelphis domestica]